MPRRKVRTKRQKKTMRLERTAWMGMRRNRTKEAERSQRKAGWSKP